MAIKRPKAAAVTVFRIGSSTLVIIYHP
jgi:hypothetical protein